MLLGELIDYSIKQEVVNDITPMQVKYPLIMCKDMEMKQEQLIRNSVELEPS